MPDRASNPDRTTDANRTDPGTTPERTAHPDQVEREDRTAPTEHTDRIRAAGSGREKGSRPAGAVGAEIPSASDGADRGVGDRDAERDAAPITHPHDGDATQTEPQEPRELENPPQEEGPRERNNKAD